MTPNAQQRRLLEAKLTTQFVPALPSLLKPKNPADDTKSLSRALSALALAAVREIRAKEACGAVADGYDEHWWDLVQEDYAIALPSAPSTSYP